MRGLVILLLILIAVGASVLWTRPDPAPQEPKEQPPAANAYVGSEACGSCHKDIYAPAMWATPMRWKRWRAQL